MKKTIINALSILTLSALVSYAYAETAPVDQAKKHHAAATKKSDKAKTAPADKAADATAEVPQIGTKTEGAQGRGLPKAFSNAGYK